MRELRRLLTRLLCSFAVLVLLSPWLLYELGLSRFDAMPARPTQLATAEQQAWVWAQARGAGAPKVAPRNPYGYVMHLLSRDGRAEPGELVAYWVASEYNLRQPPRSMAWWHLSNAALVIWLSRHWTTEEIASAAHAIAIKWPPRQRRAVSVPPAAAPPAR